MGLPDGKTAIITGGTSGIGLATATWYLHEGAHVFTTGRRQSELDAALAQLNTLHVLKQSSPVAADGQGAGM